MASRMEMLIASVGGDEAFEKIVRPKRVVEEPDGEQTPTASKPNPDDFIWPAAPQPDTANIDWTDRAPSEPDWEDDSEAVREQEQFLAEKGYNWWNVPKTLLPHYRPRPEKKSTVPLTADGDMDLTLDPRHGEPAPADLTSFSPFLGICKFPYKFVSRALLQPLASAFFDQGQIQDRDWDLYYVHSDANDSPKPTIFVPTSQLQTLFDEINDHFPQARVKLTPELQEEGLVIDFSDIDHPDLRPRWLGHSTARIFTEVWPTHLELSRASPAAMSQNNVELFKEKMDLANEVARNKKKGARKAKQAEVVVKRQGMGKDLLRAQKYFGLLATSEDSLLPEISNLSISPVDDQQPPPHPFLEDPIFISIDVEASETSPSTITEVGVATLDTRDLKGLAPGKYGVAWQDSIRARHFRIAEYKHLVNKKFVHGCPEKFEFGTSEFVGKDKISSKLASCFHAPFSNPKFNSDDAASPANQGLGAEEEKRNIILLGHGISNDIDYLRKLGFNPLNRGNLLETMDTQPLYQAYTHDPNPAGLGRVMYDFQLTAWNPHNAGNDAVHTMWGLLATTVAAAVERGSPAKSARHEEEQARRESVAAEEAVDRVREGAQGWDVEEGGVRLDAGGEEGKSEKGVKKSGEKKGGGVEKGFEPWKGSASGLYLPNGYPLDV